MMTKDKKEWERGVKKKKKKDLQSATFSTKKNSATL